MQLRKSLNADWTRRAVMKTGVGLVAATAVGEMNAAETSVAARTSCIDMPIKVKADDGIERESVAAAAMAPKRKSNQIKDAISGSKVVRDLNLDEGVIARAPSLAPTQRASDAATLPAQAAFLNKWPFTELNVFFHNDFGSFTTLDRVVGIVLDRVTEWSKACRITFRRVTNANEAQIRTGFQPGKGHFSFVGREAGTRTRTMNLDMNLSDIRDPYHLAVILHEFGHAIGMLHEHQNPAARLQFGSMNALLAHFGPLGLDTPEKIQVNILQRYGEDIERFSDFDPHSIMTYAIPDKVMAPGFSGTKHNLELSAVDKEYANKLYPLDSGTKPVVTESDKELAIIVGSDPVTGKLVAGGKVGVKLTVPADQSNKNISILTTGTTVVMLTLTDNTGRELTPADRPGHGSPDFMNEVINISLPAGEYKLMVVHPSPRGGGTFKVQAKSGTFSAPLTSPNRRS